MGVLIAVAAWQQVLSTWLLVLPVAYGIQDLRGDLERFIFLLGGTGGPLFGLAE